MDDQETTPREKTVEEVRKEFLDYVWSMIDYWAGEGGSNVDPDKPVRERLSGFAHSLLATLDGCAMALPGFVVAPCPHPDDKEFCIAEGEDWYPQAPELPSDIAGGLHELLYQHDPRRRSGE